MKKRTFAQRIISLMLTLSFVALLFSGGDAVRQEERLQSSATRQSIIAADVSRLVQGVCSGELLAQRAAKLTHLDASEKQEQHRVPDRFLWGCSFNFIAAVVLYLTLFRIFRQVQFRRRYIIKYIHDQDGYKNRAPFYSAKEK